MKFYVLKREKHNCYLAREGHVGWWTKFIKYARKFERYDNAAKQRDVAISFFELTVNELSIIEVKKDDVISI